ncbi:hypothetical protein, partial [Herbiconiux daphne]
MTTKSKGIETELSQEIGSRVIEHRNRFYRLFFARYMELLPTCIAYYNGDTVGVDWLKVEVALRQNYQVVIGEATNGVIMMLGYAKNNQSVSQPNLFFHSRTLNEKDIQWIVPNKLRPKEMQEITELDEAKTGNFVVLRNKVLNYTSDVEIIQHYVEELAEVVSSRFSLTIQAKIMTIFLSEIGDETINQIVTELYNGTPYVKASKLFDPADQIHTFDNTNLASALVELKREYQNKISELNSMIGLNSLAVEKSSGVSDTEAKSNRAFTTSNGNIYIKGRENPLRLLNKRYGTEIHAIYDDDAISKMTIIERTAEIN